jgi:hypothetical protein
MSADEKHDPATCRGQCLEQIGQYEYKSTELNPCVPAPCPDCLHLLPQWARDANGGRCINCAVWRHKLPNWKGPGYRPDKRAYKERKQAYDKVEESKRTESKERKMLVQQIIDDGATITNILKPLMKESKQNPKGPWRIVEIIDQEVSVSTFRTIDDFCDWLDDGEHDEEEFDCQILIRLAHLYHKWKHGKYGKTPPDFLELFFIIVMETVRPHFYGTICPMSLSVTHE